MTSKGNIRLSGTNISTPSKFFDLKLYPYLTTSLLHLFLPIVSEAIIYLLFKITKSLLLVFEDIVCFMQDGEAYAHLLNVLAPEHSNPSTLAVNDPLERAKLVLEHADKMGCKRYLTAKDIVEGSPNLNLAFVAHIFQHR